MRRKEWFELHDHRLYPGFLRNLVTDALEAIWSYTNSYRVILPRLRTAMEDAGTNQIVDLCSGGGGPWIGLRESFTTMEGFPVSIVLTDKYPNYNAFTRAGAGHGIKFCSASVDALQIPADIHGFRTIFSTFHHFNPEQARAILAEAAMHHQGIAVFEVAKRSLSTMFAIVAVPVLNWHITPRMRPFRWSRILWTYLLPIVPFTLFVDGVLSCLRAYSLEDLRELTDGLGGDEYQWEIGEESGGHIGITYLVGRPRRHFAADGQIYPSVFTETTKARALRAFSLG
ncbi:MAG TPA: class I SAM-dependent methyltransferase [Pseudacidobacterium sp.]|jgi:hypothetical protein|nr:class I SAM-dependent methyltransferase [Pseudacidobacterium sp.]